MKVTLVIYASLLRWYRMRITVYDLDSVRETSVEIVLIVSGATLVV